LDTHSYCFKSIHQGMNSMKVFRRLLACALALALVADCVSVDALDTADKKHHHHHKKGGHHHHHKGHHHHHGKHHNATSDKVESHTAETTSKSVFASKPAPTQAFGKAHSPTKAPATKLSKDDQLVEKMKALEVKLAAEKKKRAADASVQKGHILVSGPVPADFAQQFSNAVAAATGADAKKVVVTKTAPVGDQPDIVSVDFSAPAKTIADVQTQAADSDSKLARGKLHSFLVAKGDEDDDEADAGKKDEKAAEEPKAEAPARKEATPVESKGIDIDTAMPYGDLEPFGREDTAQELTEDSVKESDEMVDQLERAEVAEEKRSVFRALTRLRGAAITSFDGVARSQTGNIDEYNKIHKWRNNHPLHHLADEESDISKWAFPDNADF